MNNDIYTFQGNWQCAHQCTPLKKSIKGPFPTKEEAEKALAAHKEKCK